VNHYFPAKILKSIACMALVLLTCITGWKLLSAGERITEDRQRYSEEAAQTYSYRFGKGQPFFPSNAKIQGDAFIQAGAFPTAQYCRSCHESVYHQWRQSLHANSFRTPFYTKNVGLLQNEKGIEFSRHCEGCHNPIELFAGQVTPHPVSKDRESDQDGVTCMVCHSIAKLQPTYGVGSYVMGVPSVMLDEHGNPIQGEVSYAEIMNHVDRHKAAVMKDFYRTPEYCAACHKANIPKALNNYKWLRAIGLYDEWQQSSYAKQSPLPFYQKDYRTCQSCHMPREAALQNDAAAKRGMVLSHRWVGGNTAVPSLYGYEEQLEKTLEFLKADKLNIDLFALARPGGSGLIAPLGSKPFTIEPGNSLEALIVIQNKGIGHTLLPEQRDIYQAWVEFELSDATGTLLQASGRLDPEGRLDPNAHTFVTRLLDGDGHLLVQHEIWKRHTTASDATIRPGRSTLVRYGFRIPREGRGPYTITAKVNYRHFNEAFTNFALGDKHPAYPVAEMAVASRELGIGENTPTPSAPRDTPDWMRWNNFGIALLDQGQYAQAQKAFFHVLSLRPDYGDAYTNLGIVYLQWEDFSAAGSCLTRALTMMPNDARALYYQALVERNEGELHRALSDLRKVAALFPRSTDVHRELGFTYYQQNEFALAKTEYETLQRIDPDDSSAHYYLAIIYRRQGDVEKAAAESALYAEKKDDPLTNSSPLEYRRSHPEVFRESLPWHMHVAKDTGINPVTE
jgi:tetratricopeptide (TPR) repeat protein/nitrate/TMAO reductase-like tetraheme cytochrome c subunit